MNINFEEFPWYTNLLIFLICIILIAIGPIVILWALNTIFPLLSIPYSFTTWLATLILNWNFFGVNTHYLSKIKEKL